MKSNIKMYLYITGSLLFLISSVLSCGMTTHNTVARRAYNFSSFEGFTEFKQYISENFDVFDAGAAFPDFGYDCAGLANESEAAHWPPFLRAGSQYLIDTYPQPWSHDGIRLAVFLLGVASHQVADISWHSIGGIQEGLIRAMAGQDFNGVYSTAHTNADEGGEFELAYNYDLSWLSDKWYVPITDIKNIFHLLNYTRVNYENLLRCNAVLYAGAMGVKIGGRFLYPEIAKKSPFLVDHYQDYFNGGLDDMSIWTSYCWPVLMGWLNGSTIGEFCFIQPDPNNSDADSGHLPPTSYSKLVLGDESQENENSNYNSEKHLEESDSISSLIGSQLAKQIFSQMKIVEDKQGASYELPTTIEKIIDTILDKFKEEEEKILDYINRFIHPKYKQFLSSNKIKITQEQPKQKEIQDLQHPFLKDNRNYNFKSYINRNDNNIKINDNNNLESNFSTIYGQNMYGYFGRDFRSVDLNNDGLDDIIISSPGYGQPGTMQTGCVFYVISNTTDNYKPFYDDTSNYNIDQIAAGKVCGFETHSKFGWNVEVLDFNLDGVLDLIVGAPSSFNAELTYKGMLYIYFGSIGDDGSKWYIADPNKPSIIMKGIRSHDALGTVIRSADCNGDGYLDLILGTPNSHGGGSQRGMVSIFYSSKNRLPGNLTLEHSDYSVHGSVDYEWFGNEIKVSNAGDKALLLVGSPNFHFPRTKLVNIGKITAYAMNSKSNQFEKTPKFTILGSGNNDKLGYNFHTINGSSFGLNNVNDIIILSLPTRGFGDEYDQVGEVVLIDVDPLRGINSIKDIFPLLSIRGTAKYSRFGESLLVGKIHQADEFAQLFVGAPLWTDTIETGSGCVFSYSPNDHLVKDQVHFKQNKINNTPVIIYDNVHSIKTYNLSNIGSASSSLNNKRKDSRFGFRTCLSDFNNDGRKDLIVSADRDSSKLLEAGSINIFVS
ncbi:hypothetical protein DICPUDRAFT_96554 [Dictyostelium purpureum]|uniref:Phosphatidylinositol-glycan-specific phospholipase D n=1 Tax=Dictyostelium purpureum TaxID=5786 RepID=F0Z9B8_DICPU|nr:uncharacterized protein DICPUDRAFT_96554 [Dictyostelium purpureum]EGC39443.1 hypothetical protein DICPUDRAFT_96554 [Dictyostelium purpureum]|eukprot:XP_003284001.1 hypothetical protein DICPUDRAFT_96554 [Dictyostelium purpureum]